MSETLETSKDKSSQRQNVRVVCRVRPVNNMEKTRGSECVKLTDTSIQISASDIPSSPPFFFDKVYGPNSTQVRYQMNLQLV